LRTTRAIFVRESIIMHRLVIWGFALALIPLSIAAVWEAIIVLRAYLIQALRKEPASSVQSPES
jgi:hypothetical protein